MLAPSLNDYSALEMCQRFVFFMPVLIMLQSVLYFYSTPLPLLPHSAKIKYLSSYKSFIRGGNRGLDQVLLQLNMCWQNERKCSQWLILSRITRVTLCRRSEQISVLLVPTFCPIVLCWNSQNSPSQSRSTESLEGVRNFRDVHYSRLLIHVCFGMKAFKQH